MGQGPDDTIINDRGSVIRRLVTFGGLVLPGGVGTGCEKGKDNKKAKRCIHKKFDIGQK